MTPYKVGGGIRVLADKAEKAQLLIQAPKVLFADSVTASKQSYLIGEQC